MMIQKAVLMSTAAAGLMLFTTGCATKRHVRAAIAPVENRVGAVEKRTTQAEADVMTLWLRNCEARNDRVEAAQVACELGDRSLNDGDLNAARDWFRRASGLDAGKIEAGDIAAQVREQALVAREGGRRLLVYVGAPWCEPCGRFHQAAEKGELDAIFPPMTFLEFDSDADSARLGQAGDQS